MGRTPLLWIILMFMSVAAVASESPSRDFDFLARELDRSIPRLADMLGEDFPPAGMLESTDLRFEDLIGSVDWPAPGSAVDLDLARAALLDAGKAWDRARTEVLAALADGDRALARDRFAERFAPCSVELYILIEASRRAASIKGNRS